MLDENIAGEEVAAVPSAHTYARSNAEVMQSVMGVTPEPVVAETEPLRKYMALVEQSDWRSTEVAAMRLQLESALGADHPSLIRADMIIRRREALAR